MNWITQRFFLSALALVFAETAVAVSHSYVSSMRSSYKSYYFFDHRLVGYQGIGKSERNPASYSLIGSDNPYGLETLSEENKHDVVNTDWRGQGLRSTLGIELINFVIFDIGHTYRVLKSHQNSNETLQGSSLHGGMKIFFRAPLVNIEGGIGMMGSQMDARDGLATGTYYGTGTYRNLGLQYFYDSRLSITTSYTEYDERLTVGSGKDSFSNTKRLNLKSIDIGFRIWK